MRFQKNFEQKNTAEIENLIEEQPYCYLSTQHQSTLHTGVFNHDYRDGVFILHLNRKDEQIADLKAHPEALVVLHDFLSVIPSYWLETNHAGAATSYYRYAEFRCSAQILETKTELCYELQKLMEQYQPEGNYEPLSPDHPMYQADFSALAIVKLKPYFIRTKWKLGQNRSESLRKNVIKNLRNRSLGQDLRTALLVESSLDHRVNGPSVTSGLSP